MTYNIIKTTIIFILSIVSFIFIYIGIVQFKSYLPSQIKLEYITNIPDFLNSIVSIPITLAGTLLALILAKVAYEITIKEVNRDNLILATDKYSEYYNIFATFALNLHKVIDNSSLFFDDFDEMTQMDRGDHQDHEDHDFYTVFYTSIKNKLNDSDFFYDLKQLENSIILIQSNSILSSFIESSMADSDIKEILKSIRGWGNIPGSYGDSDKIKGERLFEIISLFTKRMSFDEGNSLIKNIDFYDSNIDFDKFPFIFFGSQLFKNKAVFYDVPRTHYDNEYKKYLEFLKKDPDAFIPDIRNIDDFIKYSGCEDKSYGSKYLYLELYGLNILHNLLNLIPSEEALKILILENYDLDSNIFDKITTNAPSNIIDTEKKIISTIISSSDEKEKTPIGIIREDAMKNNIKILRNHYIR